MIPRYVGSKKSTSKPSTPEFTSAIAEECRKITMAYTTHPESSSAGGEGIVEGGGNITNRLDDDSESSDMLLNELMKGTASSGDIIDLDLLLTSGLIETQSEPSATPPR